MNIDELAKEIRDVNKANGWAVLHPEEWHDQYKVPAILALIHSEVSEALEEFRASRQSEFVVELADVLIRVLDCAGGLTTDFESVVRAKIEKNRQRPHKHGGKRI